MSVRVLSFAAIVAVTATAFAAEAETPAYLQRNNDAGSRGTTIRGQAPIGSNIITIDRAELDRTAQNATPAAEPPQTVTDPPGGYLLFSPPSASEPETASTTPEAFKPLPVEIVFHNMKSADCFPADVIGAALKKLQASAACVELARETEQFKTAYKNDPRVLDALATRRVR